jgi:RNA recognition motif-containing protein
MHIHITNLDLNLIEADLQRLFTPYGEVKDLQIIRDQWNNRPKGRAFLEMPVEKEAQQAILSLNGVLLGRKNIVVTGEPHTEEHLNRYFNF